MTSKPKRLFRTFHNSPPTNWTELDEGKTSASEEWALISFPPGDCSQRGEIARIFTLFSLPGQDRRNQRVAGFGQLVRRYRGVAKQPGHR